jgi:hypothetical protein
MRRRSQPSRRCHRCRGGRRADGARERKPLMMNGPGGVRQLSASSSSSAIAIMASSVRVSGIGPVTQQCQSPSSRIGAASKA